jgi:hypothetical protein
VLKVGDWLRRCHALTGSAISTAVEAAPDPPRTCSLTQLRELARAADGARFAAKLRPWVEDLARSRYLEEMNQELAEVTRELAA